jgi:hypothetical protein
LLRILKEQMEALGARTRTRFVQKITDYLLQHFKACFDEMSRADVEAWVGAGIDKAEKYGITTEPEVAQLLLLFLVLGLDADETTPWVAEVLRDRELVGLGKVRKLSREAREREIEGVESVLVVAEVIDA